jgi:hypothetical protein
VCGAHPTTEAIPKAFGLEAATRRSSSYIVFGMSYVVLQ